MKARRLTARALPWTAALFLFSTGFSAAQSDDFDDGDNDSWIKLDPIAGLPGGSPVTFAEAGGVYRISGPQSPNPAYGNARAAAIRPDIYANFCVAVDITTFDASLGQAFGILARIQPNPGIQAVNAYALTIDMNADDLDISLIQNEAPVAIGASTDIPNPLDPAREYRLVFMGNGAYLEGRLYDKTDLLNPLAVVSVVDATHAMGTCGLLVADLGDTDGGIDATFDNYAATNGTPPPLTILMDAFDEGRLTWPDSALCFTLQTTTTLGDGSWVNVAAGIFHQAGPGQFLVGIQFADDPTRCWRLKLNDGT